MQRLKTLSAGVQYAYWQPQWNCLAPHQHPCPCTHMVETSHGLFQIWFQDLPHHCWLFQQILPYPAYAQHHNINSLQPARKYIFPRWYPNSLHLTMVHHLTVMDSNNLVGNMTLPTGLAAPILHHNGCIERYMCIAKISHVQGLSGQLNITTLLGNSVS